MPLEVRHTTLLVAENATLMRRKTRIGLEIIVAI
jgi:hypothetical protein